MRRAIALVLIPVAFAAACGEDAIDPVTGGEGNGSTGFAVIVTDDPSNDPSPSPSASPSAPRAIEGFMTGAIRVSLRNDAGALVNLGVMQDVEIPLQEGGDSLRLSDLERPPADEYVGIQLRFEGVTVTVNSGSEVGDSTLTSNVVMNVGTGSLATIEIVTPGFDIDSETDLDIIVDLNSELWVTGENLDDNLVPQTDLASNVSVEID
jgi:hypothetical protein